MRHCFQRNTLRHKARLLAGLSGMMCLGFACYLYLAKTFGTSAHGIRTLCGPLGHARFGVQVMPAFVICNRPLRSWLSSSSRIVNPVDARRISIFLALSLNCLAIYILLPILLSWLRVPARVAQVFYVIGEADHINGPPEYSNSWSRD
jgi:hypothetical protein